MLINSENLIEALSTQLMSKSHLPQINYLLKRLSEDPLALLRAEDQMATAAFDGFVQFLNIYSNELSNIEKERSSVQSIWEVDDLILKYPVKKYKTIWISYYVGTSCKTSITWSLLNIYSSQIGNEIFNYYYLIC
jgi:hypothetical protein